MLFNTWHQRLLQQEEMLDFSQVKLSHYNGDTWTREGGWLSPGHTAACVHNSAS